MKLHSIVTLTNNKNNLMQDVLRLQKKFHFITSSRRSWRESCDWVLPLRTGLETLPTTNTIKTANEYIVLLLLLICIH